MTEASAFKRNREAWLCGLVDLLRPRFDERGLALPKEVAISCGWPSRNATGSRSRRVGECWNAACSAAERPEIFISPLLADPVEVGHVVLHELIHAALPEAGHGPEFRRAALGLGLVGKMTATVPSDALRDELASLVKPLGQYDHAQVTAHGRRTQSTRLLKASCPGCGYTVRVTAKWVEVGLPTCPCGEVMEVEG